MAKEGEDKKKVKRSTALKRDDQNSKKRLANRVFKSQVRTAVKAFEAAVAAGDAAVIKEKLSDVYAFMDKGVKKGIFKLNKASRVKSRMTAKIVVKA